MNKFIIILFIVLLMFKPVCAHAEKPPGMPPVPVEVAGVKYENIKNAIELIGIVQPELSTNVVAEVGGVITMFYKDEGEQVKKGEIICRLDDLEKDVAFKLARFRLEQAKAQLAKLQQGFRKEEIEMKRAVLENKKANREKLLKNNNRINELFSNGIASEEQKQNSTLEYEQANASFMEAKAELELVLSGERQEDIVIAQQEVEVRKQTVRELENLLGKTLVRAPVSGFITIKHKETGMWVDEGSSVADIVSTENVLVDISVHESQISQVSLGAGASIAFNSFPEKTFTGKVKKIIPSADLKSHAFPVKIEIENRSHTLMPGMFAKVSLHITGEHQGTTIPIDALIKNGNRFSVFVVRDKTALELEVEKGEVIGSDVEVKGGISLEDKVIIVGNEKLRSGATVNVIN